MVLAFLGDMTGEGDAGPGHGGKPGALRTVADDHQPAAGHRPDPLPQPQQQIDPLVLDQPPHGQEQRLRRLGGQWAGLRHAVVHQPDPVRGDPEAAQRGRGRAGDRHHQIPAVRTGQRPVLQAAAEPGGGPRAAQPPQVRMDMVDQAQGGTAVPQRRQIGHAVADLDQEVAVADPARQLAGYAQVMTGVAARGHHPVAAGGGASRIGPRREPGDGGPPHSRVTWWPWAASPSAIRSTSSSEPPAAGLPRSRRARKTIRRGSGGGDGDGRRCWRTC